MLYRELIRKADERLTPICSDRKGDVTMSVNVNEIIRKLNRAERKKVEDRAAERTAEEMSLRDFARPGNSRRLAWRTHAEPLKIVVHDWKSAATNDLYTAKDGQSDGR